MNSTAEITVNDSGYSLFNAIQNIRACYRAADGRLISKSTQFQPVRSRQDFLTEAQTGERPRLSESFSPIPMRMPLRSAFLLASLFASITFLIHFLSSIWGSHLGYGYFRDELYFLVCGRHLDWGYVASLKSFSASHPPAFASSATWPAASPSLSPACSHGSSADAAVRRCWPCAAYSPPRCSSPHQTISR